MMDLSGLAIGLMLTFSAAALGLRQMLMSPGVQNYPQAPLYVRIWMFCWMVGLAYRGAEILLSLAGPTPETFKPGAIWATFFLAGYQGSMLAHILRQRLPARFWRRVNRAVDLACCGRALGLRQARRSALDALPARWRPRDLKPKPSPAIAAMAELRLMGVPTIGPGEPPSALLEEVER